MLPIRKKGQKAQTESMKSKDSIDLADPFDAAIVAAMAHRAQEDAALIEGADLTENEARAYFAALEHGELKMEFNPNGLVRIEVREPAEWVVALTARTEQSREFCMEQNNNFNRERWLGYIVGTNGPNGGAR